MTTMEFYKILRIKEGKQFTISKTGLSLMKSEPDFEKNFTTIGQCDINGNLLEDVKSANFSPKVDDSQIPPIFTSKNNQQNGKGQQQEQANAGGTGTSEPKLTPKRRVKSGGKTNAGADKENGNFGAGD